jgi:hypothetical protein
MDNNHDIFYFLNSNSLEFFSPTKAPVTLYIQQSFVGRNDYTCTPTLNLMTVIITNMLRTRVELEEAS